MFSWLRIFKKEEPECLRFLRSLAEKEQPKIHYEKFRHHYGATLTYSLVKVKIVYNDSWREWELNIFDRKTCNSLYGYYMSWNQPPVATRDFLLETYHLWEEIQKMMKTDEEKEYQDKQQVELLKKKYLP